MSSIKSALKAAKAALDSQNYDEAVTQANQVLASDPRNYHANVFLGLALDKQGNFEEAIKAYDAATKIKDNDALAWQGLVNLYENQTVKNVDDYRQAAVRLAEIYMKADDQFRCQSVIDKLTLFAKAHGSRLQYEQALKVILPTSTIYDFLEGRLPHPSYTFKKLAGLKEADEKERINKLIGERRTRLGAKIDRVTAEVKREVFSESELENIYQSIIDWSDEDEVRREYEEKLLVRAYESLVVSPLEKKKEKRIAVEKLAHGLVVLKHPFALAWKIALEWKDDDSLQAWDRGVLNEYIQLFPTDGLGKVLRGYISSEISPFPPSPVGNEQAGSEKDTADEDTTISTEDRLILMTDGIGESPSSALAHRLMAEYYLYLEEHESAVESSRKARKLLKTEAQLSGLKFENNNDAVDITLATALIQYQAPKNHPEAKSLFDAVLKRKPTFTSALIGVGLILEEQEDFAGAIDFLSRALERDPQNARVRSESAWCKALSGKLEIALEELEACLHDMSGSDPRSKDLKAQTLYRVGMCLWNLDPSKASRKDRKGAYARFLAALQANLNYSPAYTALGIYYADYAKDRKRARKCFQKAFELSPSEIEAAERLARAFANQGDWDLVEVVAQRAVESGKVRPPPGSRKKGLSWPFAALGVVHMNKQDYAKSVISFQSALRISPEDYHSWVGLGESYHNSGRYIAATKAFQQAEKLEEDVERTKAGETWFAKYMLANVKRELGDYDEAVEDYQAVLDLRSREFGVSVALLQTLVETAWRNVELGFFGKAAESARRAIQSARVIAEDTPAAFNLWKAVGDACSIWSWVQSHMVSFSRRDIKQLLETGIDTQEYDLLVEVDGVGRDILASLGPSTDSMDPSVAADCLHAAILAQKRAIYTSASDIHAQAVAWYNLGWTEQRAHSCLVQESNKSNKPSKYLKAAMRCFKRAIELESGNAEFWNALGIATTQLNPKVAQHSFVRSLHLNERSARVWTNLGTLYLLEDDYQLANDALTRAQSTDPDYAQAWVGQGSLALMLGDPKEAQLLFTHAFEIADSASFLIKRQYALSTFDHLLDSPAAATSINSMIQPIFALHQLHSQCPSALPYHHLAALYLERIGDYATAISRLTTICTTVEAEYEVSEAPSSLARFAKAKADLARSQLAVRDYASAAESAETSLDLSSDEESSGLEPQPRRKCRLSAQMTAGLARYFLNDMDQALGMFRSALEESNGSPDVVCLLAQVLWAKGGEQERDVAKEQLFDCIENNPGHVNATELLGVIAILDGDTGTVDAVADDLRTLASDDTLHDEQQRRIGKLLVAISTLSAQDESPRLETTTEVATSILLSPWQPHVWSELANLTEDTYPAEMALKTAAHAIPPGGSLDAEDLAKAFAGTKHAGDAQRSIMTAPWVREGWEGLETALK
ncbi:MAG: hypothetical protein M1819_000560 [Sarea resinae]|nr:MAG: hypothetical protein M1819_000560 [Sarea resinae]